MNTIKTQLNFGGFYDTIHSSIVEDSVAMDLGALDECDENDWENEDLINFNNWTAFNVEYCKEWVKLLNNELETEIVFTDLDSPREHNFSTDVIIAHITVKDTLKLFKQIKELDLKDDVIEAIEKHTTSYDGYAAYYKYADMFKSEHRYFLIEIMIDVLLENYHEENDGALFVEEFYPEIPTLEVA